MKTHGHPLSVTAQHFYAGGDDYLQRMNELHNTAQQQRKQYETDQGVVWPNAQTLRHYSHTLEISDNCFTAAKDCMKYAHRAQRKYSHHVALCKTKDTAPVSQCHTALLSLAEVAQQHSEHSYKEHEPPGRSFTRSVLATCHASNAPGVFGLSHHKQESVST